jgi:hypothetical protein
VISVGCDSIGFAKIRRSSLWPEPKSLAASMCGRGFAKQAI